VHPNTEHQKDDTNLGELRRQFGVCDKAGRERSDGYSGQKIPEKWWETHSTGNVSTDQGVNQAGGHGRNECDVMVQGVTFNVRRSAFNVKTFTVRRSWDAVGTHLGWSLISSQKIRPGNDNGKPRTANVFAYFPDG
jgi:hypothetical protein